MPSRRADQCSYYEEVDGRRRRCRRNGTGNPPICQKHTEELDQREGNPIADVLSSLLQGKRPAQRDVENAVRSTMEGLFGKRMTEAELADLLARARAAARGQTPDPWAGSRGSPSGPSSDARSQARDRERAEADKAREISWARRTLGFTAREPLDGDVIKKRFRELARKHHPDVGGDVRKMADINRAVEILSGPG